MDHNSIVLNKTESVSWWFSGKVFFQQLVCMSSNPAIFLFFFGPLVQEKLIIKKEETLLQKNFALMDWAMQDRALRVKSFFLDIHDLTSS